QFWRFKGKLLPEIADSGLSLKENNSIHQDITFTTRFDSMATSFQFSIPIRINGIKTGSSLILLFSPSSISSFEVTAESPAVPSASSTHLIDFHLANSDVHYTTEGQELLAPLQAQSSTVLDAIHELANRTALSYYVNKESGILDAIHELANSTALSIYIQCISQKLHSVPVPVRDIISRGLSLVIHDDIVSMYAGMGAKVTELPTPDLQSPPPPSKDQTEQPPPQAPNFNTRKRRRCHDDREERDDDIAQIWDQLESMRKQHGAELQALREERDDLKHEVKDLRERLAAHVKNFKGVEEEFESLATRTDKKFEEMGDDMDVKFLDAKSDIRDMAEKVKGVKEDVDEDKLVNRTKYKVLDHLRTSLNEDLSSAD
ncbi:hypothetical protein LB507_011010, partial [Fusarium sp. FIESC RH6]